MSRTLTQKARATRPLIALLTMVLLACSGAESVVAPDVAIDGEARAAHQRAIAALPQELADAANAEWERAHGPIDPVDPEEPRPWGDDWGTDAAFAEQVDKVTGGQVVLHGWAVRGQLGQLGDGRQHWLPISFNYGETSFASFQAEHLGRCGRLDGFRDHTFKPCILPHGRNNGGSGKRKKWKFDTASCPVGTDLQTVRDVLRFFIFAEFGAFFQTGWSWVEQTGAADNDTFVIYCATGVDKGKLDLWDALAAAYPAGSITLSHYDGDSEIANYFEVCSQPDSTGAQYNYMVDAMYYYKHARIALNWNRMWSYIRGCTPVGSAQSQMLIYIFMHEMAHALGFAHQTDPGTASDMNFMKPNRLCGDMIQTLISFRPFMKDTLVDYSLPVLQGETLNLWWKDLACYSPAGPP